MRWVYVNCDTWNTCNGCDDFISSSMREGGWEKLANFRDIDIDSVPALFPKLVLSSLWQQGKNGLHWKITLSLVTNSFHSKCRISTWWNVTKINVDKFPKTLSRGVNKPQNPSVYRRVTIKSSVELAMSRATVVCDVLASKKGTPSRETIYTLSYNRNCQFTSITASNSSEMEATVYQGRRNSANYDVNRSYPVKLTGIQRASGINWSNINSDLID